MNGERERARRAAAEALPLLWRNGWAYLLLDSLAYLAALDGNGIEGARLLGVADAWYANHGDARQPNEATLEGLAAGAIAALLGDRASAQGRAEGRALDDPEALALARRVAAGHAIRPDHDDDENEGGGKCCENERVGHRLLWWLDHTAEVAACDSCKVRSAQVTPGCRLPGPESFFSPK